MNPTIDTYEELHKAYLHYNAELFENKLPLCMITLSRQHDTDGYFSANQFVNLEGANLSRDHPQSNVLCYSVDPREPERHGSRDGQPVAAPGR